MAQDVQAGTDYTVEQDDTLSEIAQQAYGNADQWPKIYEANKETIGDNPNVLNPGEVLHIPE